MELTKKEKEIYEKGKQLQKRLGTDLFSSQIQDLMNISRSNASLYIKILSAKGKIKNCKKGSGSKRIHFT